MSNSQSASPRASTSGAVSARVPRPPSASASEDEQELQGAVGAPAAPNGPARALSLPHTLRRAPSARSLQRRLSGVFEGHHVPLQKLRRQMGDPKGEK